MPLRLRLLIALLSSCLALRTATSAPAPTVEETIVGPAGLGGVYVLSPSGGRIAYAGMKGTRLTVTVDGVEGPVFDELYSAHGQSFVSHPQALVARATPGGSTADPLAPVIFSPDGAHYAYAGRQGAEYVVIHDGKEVARGPRERLSLNYGPLALSPGGRFVYFMEMDRPGGGNAKWRLSCNGKAGPWSSNNHGMTIVFSADDARYAYNATSEKDPAQQILVVDGKPAGYLGMRPVFTADGKTLLTISPATSSAPKPAVLVDGKPAFTALGIDKIIVAPSGRRWGAIVRTKLVEHTQVAAFFLDGKEVPGTEGAQNAWFSADGKHYAVACQNAAARSAFLVIDGRKQPEYQSVATDENTFWWTPDGSTFLYTITSGGRPFLIVNGEERPLSMLIGHRKITMAQAGKRYGYGTRDGSNRVHSLVVDGQDVLPAGTRPYDDTLTFSPDGSRYAFFAGPALRNELTTLVLDGKVQEGITPHYFAPWENPALILPAFAFSPDGRHIAYLARHPGGTGNALHLDGLAVTPAVRAVFFPTFTPDGRHFFWVADELAGAPGQGSLTVVYVDGLEAVRANGRFFTAVPGSFTMDPEGVVTFFAADGDAVKRYRITASAETSVATLRERGNALAAAAAEAKAAAAKAAEDEIAARKQAQEEAAAQAARAKAEQEARVAESIKARQEAFEAKRRARLLQLENAKRARQGLPPLKELPASP